MLLILVLIIAHHLMLIIEKYQLLRLMIAMVQQKKNLGLTLVKQIQILFKFTAILCKVDPDPDPDLKNKRTLDV